MEKNEILTTEAQRLTGYGVVYLRLLARTGKVKARKLAGKVWAFDRDSLLEWKRNARPGPKRRR